jgi:hypothetical protein
MRYSLAAALLLLIVSAPVCADVLVVNIWHPMPGKGAVTLQNAQEAKVIHAKMGVNTIVGVDQMGRVHYGMGFPSWEAWGQFQAKAQANAEWSAFVAKIGQAPSAELEDVYLMNQPAPGPVGRVYQVFIWKSMPGQAAKTLQTAMGAKPIQEKLGAKVGINVDQLGRMHYVLSFDSWDAWAKFQSASAASKEWTDYIGAFNANPSAELVKIYMANQVATP